MSFALFVFVGGLDLQETGVVLVFMARRVVLEAIRLNYGLQIQNSTLTAQKALPDTTFAFHGDHHRLLLVVFIG